MVWNGQRRGEGKGQKQPRPHGFTWLSEVPGGTERSADRLSATGFKEQPPGSLGAARPIATSPGCVAAVKRKPLLVVAVLPEVGDS